MNRLMVAAAAVSMTGATAHAGGLFVPGMGPQGQARAGAIVAKADDGTALAHNPAGFAKQDGTQVFLGVNLIRMSLHYTRTGQYEPTGEDLGYEGQDYPEVANETTPSPGIGGFQALPYLTISTDFGMPQLPIRAAIGFFVPQANAGRDFDPTVTLPNGSEAPGPQRYDVFTQSGKAGSPSLAVSYRVLDSLDVGARASWGFSSIHTKKVVWAVRNFEEYNEKDSVTTIEASDSFVPAWGAGALWRPSPSFELGAAYASAHHIRSHGTVSSDPGSEVPAENAELTPVPDDFSLCEKGGVVGALKICVNLNLPQTASLGGRWILRDGEGDERADVEVDVKWEDWSEASETETISDAEAANGPLDSAVVSHGFQDVISVRVGGSYTMKLGQRHDKLNIRAGVAHDTKTAPVSWTRLDQDGKPRTVLATGVAYTAGSWRVEAGGGIVLEPDRTVANDCLPPNGPEPSGFGGTGCDGDGATPETPVDDRTRPDPAQPLVGPKNQLESPFNAGLYESHYILMHVGITRWF